PARSGNDSGLPTPAQEEAGGGRTPGGGSHPADRRLGLDLAGGIAGAHSRRGREPHGGNSRAGGCSFGRGNRMKNAAPVILIVSENRIFRESLAGSFATEPDLRIGGVSGSEDLFARLPAVAPDVVLLDMGSLGPVAESLLHDLRRSHPEIPILAMGMLDAEHAVARLLGGRVVGFVGKQEPLETLRRALTVVARGETWAPRRATARALAGLAQERRVETVTLTPRERELLSLLSGGYRNREL